MAFILRTRQSYGDQRRGPVAAVRASQPVRLVLVAVLLDSLKIAIYRRYL